MDRSRASLASSGPTGYMCFGFQGAGGAGCAGSGRVEVFSSCYSFGFGFQGAGGAGCAGSGRVELFSFYF
ncbi:hypothetical protein NPIL_28301 [Nephila pilipes]|uniref:Uncharacterized protein n=1 Tax=Nephila pilipes TaxID=299642 RepID=A0A8X6NTJ8_NEPPI|nr:hypothetical protein NPIL_28301 [Nephila pilipes]